MSAALTGMWHGGAMTTLAPVNQSAALPPRETQAQPRTPANYGAAVTHRDAVRETKRVDPVALAQKKMRAADVRSSDAERERAADDKGRHIDIEV